MKNFLINFNWTNFNWTNLTFFIIFVLMMCMDIDRGDYKSACVDGLFAIFNIFLIIVLS